MTQAKVEAVNKLLLEGEPGNISIDEHSGYTGYKPQSLIDAMNEVFWGEWGFEELSSSIELGDKGGLAIAQVQVYLKGIDFKPTSWGQNRVTRGDIGDARKGAQTDAIKKALSYFSIGNRAYWGLLKADSKGNSNVKSIHTQQNGAKVAQANGTTAQPMNFNQIYNKGLQKGKWTKETFPSIASGILNGHPINKESVNKLTAAQLAQLDAAIEQESAA